MDDTMEWNLAAAIHAGLDGEELIFEEGGAVDVIDEVDGDEEAVDDMGEIYVIDIEADDAAENRGRGRPSTVDLFPDIVPVVLEFMKSNGFSAQVRRRNTTGKSVGVHISQILEHVLAAVPGLKEYGISKSTIRRLLKPPQ
jgi:hypothetical protein